MDQVINQSITPANQDAASIYWLSSRLWYGRTTADLEAMGIRLTGKHEGNFIEAMLPTSWRVAESSLSPFQKVLLDQHSTVRARLYYQPGSAGGGMEMAIEETAIPA